MHAKFSKEQIESLRVKLDGLLNEYTTIESEEKGPKISAVAAGVTDGHGNAYFNSKGYRDVPNGEPIDKDDIFAYFSCTKSITTMGLLKLWEQGKVKLDVPAERYDPQIGSIGLIDEGQVDDEGNFKTPPRKPKTKITLRHLLTHTSGFSYNFMRPEYLLLMKKKNPHINAINPSDEFFTTEKMPLLFEPGSQWTYGHSSDWVGRIIERVSGYKLNEYLQREILDPIGMDSCTFHLKNFDKLVKMQERGGDGSLNLKRNPGINYDPKVDMGGQGCFGSVGDYLKFIRVWLNYGYSPDSQKRILKQETVEYAIENHLPDGMHIEFPSPSSVSLSEDSDPHTFSLTGNAYTASDYPSGRSKGSLYWGGLANLFFWIDMKNQIGGFWGSQILPYLDSEVVDAYNKFEALTYEVLNDSSDNKGSKLTYNI